MRWSSVVRRPGDDEVVGRRLVERRFRNVDVEQADRGMEPEWNFQLGRCEPDGRHSEYGFAGQHASDPPGCGNAGADWRTVRRHRFTERLQQF